MPLDRAKLLAKKKRHYKRHRTAIRAKAAARYAANPEPVKKRANAWWKSHPAKRKDKRTRQQKEKREQLTLAAAHAQLPRTLTAVKSLVHRAGFLAFLAGKTAVPVRAAAQEKKPVYEGKLVLGHG